MTHNFKWKEVVITVKSPNGWTRIASQYLNNLIDISAIDDANMRFAYRTATYLLANTKAVEGDLGFPVPLENPTKESVKAFVEALFGQDDTLYLLWDNAVYDARTNSSDGDLLPPDEVDEKKD